MTTHDNPPASIGPPSGLPLEHLPRPGLGRIDKHEADIAELKDTTGKHAKSIASLEGTTGEHTGKFARIEKDVASHTTSINDFKKLGDVMQDLVKVTTEANRLKRKTRNEFEQATEKLIAAVKSPRTLAAITAGAAVGAFFFSLLQSCFK